MSELQSDSMESEVIESEVIENQEIETDLATVSEAEHEEQPQVDEEAAKQEAINKTINKKHFRAMQAERERDEANAKVAEFQRKEREAQAAQVNILPEWPDDFDDNFEQKKADYIEAVERKARFNEHQNIYAQNQQFNQQQAAQAKQLEAAKLQNDFTSNAKKLGASDEEFNSVITTLNSQGLTSDTADLIMRIGEDGYLVSKYLAANPLEAQEFINSGLGMQGFKLAELKQKASVLKPKTSNAPKPATNLQGNGVDPGAGKYKNLSGTRYE